MHNPFDKPAALSNNTEIGTNLQAERIMANILVSKTAKIALALALLSAVAACGRKGPLEPPPSAQIQGGEEAGGQTAKPDRDFVLDPLI